MQSTTEMCGQIKSFQSTLAAAIPSLLPTLLPPEDAGKQSPLGRWLRRGRLLAQGSTPCHTTWWPRTVWRTQWSLDVGCG